MNVRHVVGDECKTIDIYLHSDKESSRDAAEKAGFKGEALKELMYLGYEVKITYLVNTRTYEYLMIAVNGISLEEE